MNLFNLEPLQAVCTGSRNATTRERDAYLLEIAERRGIHVPDSAHFSSDGIWTCYGQGGEVILAMPGYGASPVVTMETLDESGEVIRSQSVTDSKRGGISLKADQVLAATGLTKGRKPRADAPRFPIDPRDALTMSAAEMRAYCEACRLAAPVVEMEAAPVDVAPIAVDTPAVAIVDIEEPAPAVAPAYSKRVIGRADRALVMLVGERKGLGTRAFDNCFEAGDGDAVAACMVAKLAADAALSLRVLFGSSAFMDQGERIHVSATSYLSPALYAAALDATGRPTPTHHYAGFAEKIDAFRVAPPVPVETVEAAPAELISATETETAPDMSTDPTPATTAAADPSTAALLDRIAKLEAVVDDLMVIALREAAPPVVEKVEVAAPPVVTNAPVEAAKRERTPTERKAIIRAWRMRGEMRARADLDRRALEAANGAYRGSLDALQAANAERDAARAKVEALEFDVIDAKDRATRLLGEVETVEARMQGDADRAHGEAVKAQRDAAMWQRRAIEAGWRKPALPVAALMTGRMPGTVAA